MERISVAGAQLSSMAFGEGCPVVMLHGLAVGNMASWFSTVASPLSSSNRVVLYDQRGHGDSSAASSGYDIESQISDLQAVIDSQVKDEQPIDLVGFSMGAIIALHFSLRYPEKVRRLVLIDAPVPAIDHIAPSLQGVSTVEGLEEFIQSELLPEGVPSGRRGRRMLQRLTALFFESSLISDVRSMTPESDEQLAAMQPPVLLVYGKQSPCLSAGHRLRTLFKKAKFVLLDCGHYIPDEAPEQLTAHIKDFLGDDYSVTNHQMNEGLAA